MSRIELKTPSHVSRAEPPANLGGIGEASVPLPWSSVIAGHLSDYLELTKPRIAVLVLVCVTVGFLLGSRGTIEFPLLAHALLGIAMVAAGSSALNQLLERDSDRLMPRTANRPLPAGRLVPLEVLAFGITSGIMGVLYLASFVNLLTAMLTGLTLLTYVFLYTPLKRTSAMCTAVGANPRGVASGLGLDGGGRRPGQAQPVLVRNFVFVAVSAFSGHRLAVPRAIRPGRS